MKTIHSAVLALVCAAFVAGCGGSSDSPKAAAQKYLSSIQKGDFKAYRSLVALSEGTTEQEIREDFDELVAELKKVGAKFKIKDVDVSADAALVTFEIVSRDGDTEESSAIFFKSGKSWKTASAE